jgi:alpha-tubulin suppressor-like RCC1 family protein
VLQIACGENHTLILTSGGNVYSFGQSSHGRLGLFEEDMNTQQDQPVMIGSLTKESIGGDDEVCFVSAGGKSSFAITSMFLCFHELIFMY